jgi:hypothetical protein
LSLSSCVSVSARSQVQTFRPSTPSGSLVFRVALPGLKHWRPCPRPIIVVDASQYSHCQGHLKHCAKHSQAPRRSRAFAPNTAFSKAKKPGVSLGISREAQIRSISLECERRQEQGRQRLDCKAGALPIAHCPLPKQQNPRRSTAEASL